MSHPGKSWQRYQASSHLMAMSRMRVLRMKRFVSQGVSTKARLRSLRVDTSVAGVVTDNEFPLALTTGSVREHHGCGVRSRRAPGLVALVDEASVEINADDAKQAQLNDGDRVRVVSQHGGSVEVLVKVTSRVPVGVVFLPGFSETAPVSRLLGREGSAMPAVRLERL